MRYDGKQNLADGAVWIGDNSLSDEKHRAALKGSAGRRKADFLSSAEPPLRINLDSLETQPA